MNRGTTWLAGACALAMAAGALPAAELDDARVAKLIQATLAWDYGEDSRPLKELEAMVVEAGKDPALRKRMEEHIIRGLGAPGGEVGKRYLCRHLVIVGTDKCVPALAKLLTDEKLSHMSRYALERIPGAAADAALRDALAKVNDKLKVGMIYSLGRRHDEAAVEPVIALLSSSSDDVVTASLIALSRIDSAKAVEAVAKVRTRVPAKLKATADNAYLDCAARLAAAGKTDDAVEIYRRMFGGNESTMARIGALRGLVKTQADRAVSLAIAALADKDPKVREAAIPTLRDVPGPAATKAIADQLPRQAAQVQQRLILVLVDRGDRSALPAVVKAAESHEEAVGTAALEALGKLGDASVLPILVSKAAAASGKVLDVARASLDRLSGKDVNAAMVKALASADAKARAEIVRSLGARKAVEVTDAVFQAARDKDAAVATEALKALRSLAAAKHLPALVKLLVGLTDEARRGEAERTVVAAAKLTPGGEAPTRTVLSALADADQPAVRASLIRVLGKIGHDAALPALYRAAKDADAVVKDAAIRALAAWPTAAPAQTLWQIVKDTSNKQVHRVLAFRGYVEMIPRHTRATDAEILKMYETALDTAWRNEEKQLVLSKLAGVRHERALEMAQSCLKEPALKGAAQAAIEKIEKLLAQPASATASDNPGKANMALDGDTSTRWDTGHPMRGGEWFRIDLGKPMLVSGITLDTRRSGGDYPRQYKVYASPNMLGEGKLVAEGKGRRVTQIKWKPAVARTIRIVQTGRADGNFWSIHELKVQAKPVR